MSKAISSLLFLTLLASCRGEDPPRHGQAPPPPEIRGWEAGVAATGAELEVRGGQTFAGPASFRCVLHDESGLQVNFHTGSPGLPVVAVRIDDFRGRGSYPGWLFLTARTGAGLVTSRGDLQVTIDRNDPTAANRDLAVVSGSFEGTYRGRAGSGSIQGKFADCSYSHVRGTWTTALPSPLPSPEPEGGPGIGDDGSMP